MLRTLIGAIILFINIQDNMHLYNDIGDASSSLWGSTSSYVMHKFADTKKWVFFEKRVSQS